MQVTYSPIHDPEPEREGVAGWAWEGVVCVEAAALEDGCNSASFISRPDLEHQEIHASLWIDGHDEV